MPSFDQDDAQPTSLPWLWATMACAVGTLWINWGWGRIAGKATGQELFVLVLVSLVAYPLALGLVCTLLIAALQRSPSALRAATLLGLVALGLALFSVPSLWNMGLAAAMALFACITSSAQSKTMPTWRSSEHGRQGITAPRPARIVCQPAVGARAAGRSPAAVDCAQHPSRLHQVH